MAAMRPAVCSSNASSKASPRAVPPAVPWLRGARRAPLTLFGDFCHPRVQQFFRHQFVNQPDLAGSGSRNALGGEEVAPRLAGTDGIGDVEADGGGIRPSRTSVRANLASVAMAMSHTAARPVPCGHRCAVDAGDYRFGTAVNGFEHGGQFLRVGQVSASL